MNFGKLVPAVIAILTLAMLPGCSKKPRRPNPIDTMTGQGSAESRDDLNFGNVDTSFDNPGDAISGRLDPNDPTIGAIRGQFQNVFFDFDSASIRPAERGKLAQVADWMNSNPGSRIVLEGHCDWRGTSEYNLGLGDRRTKAVQRYLSTLGISASRLITISKGDLRATEGADGATMGQERKVEVLIPRN